ncbi:hypothetical protein [Mucilaginibacter sp.]
MIGQGPEPIAFSRYAGIFCKRFTSPGHYVSGEANTNNVLSRYKIADAHA